MVASCEREGEENVGHAPQNCPGRFGISWRMEDKKHKSLEEESDEVPCMYCFAAKQHHKEFASVPCGIIMIIPAQQALLTAIIFA